MTHSRTKFLADKSAIAVFGPALIHSVIREAEAATLRDNELLNGEIKLETAGIKACTGAFRLKLLCLPVLEIAKGFRADHRWIFGSAINVRNIK
jgi:hypothetical protein